MYSDYVCPYCLLAKAPLDEAVRGKEVEIEWMPFELRPYPTPTLRPEENYLQTVWKNSVYPMAERMAVNMKLPAISPQPYTHLAFEGYQYAKEKGKGTLYNERMLRAFFEEEINIGDVDALTRLAGELGLNEAEYRKALEEGLYREAHQKALQHAYTEANITAVPTFIIGETVLQGICPKEVLEKVISEELEKEEKNSSA